jgi:hypothetical protein
VPTRAARLLVTLLLSSTAAGCTGTATVHGDTSDTATGRAAAEEAFLARVDGIGGLTDKQLVTAAQDACYEMQLHVKTRRDLRLFVKVFTAKKIVPTEQAMLFLAAAIKTFCPDMVRFKPKPDGTWA